MLRSFLTAIFCFTFFFQSPVFAQTAAQKVFNAESFVLDNGMEIVVIPNHRVPVVTHMVWYKVGAANEPADKSGLAHFLEHLMFKGSSDLGPGEFSRTIRALGGEDNAFTSQDYTAYFQSIAAEHLETVMRMEADRMRGLNPPAREVLSERNVIIEERKQRTENDPRGHFREKMGAALYPEHPYGIPVIGWKRDIEKLNWEDVQGFYESWYHPNNAILVVAGDVTGEEVLALAQEIYGKLEPGTIPEITRNTKPPAEFVGKTDLIVESHPDIRQPSVQIGFRVPSFPQNREASLSLQILNEIIGGGQTSRLYKNLVFEQKIASGAGSYYDSTGIDESVFWVFGTPAPGTTPQQLEDALREQILELSSDKPLKAAELSDAKNRLVSEAIYARDSLSGPAMIFGQALASGASVEDVEYWPQNIAAVTLEQLQSSAATYLSFDRPHVTGHLIPQAAEKEDGAEENSLQTGHESAPDAGEHKEDKPTNTTAGSGAETEDEYREEMR